MGEICLDVGVVHSQVQVIKCGQFVVTRVRSLEELVLFVVHLIGISVIEWGCGVYNITNVVCGYGLQLFG